MPKPRGLFRILRNKFVAGLIILVPIFVTVQALWWLFRFVESFSEPLATRLFQRQVPGLGFVTTLAIVLGTGLLFSSGPLRWVLLAIEDMVESMPLVGAMYATVKKVLSGFADLRSRDAFKRFVLARLPGRTTPGFLTGTFELRRADGTVVPYCTVYVPTNHLYVGDIVVLSAADVIETDLTVEDGISVILSAGAAVPPEVGEWTAAAVIDARQAMPGSRNT